jgi:hypothetical protein
MSAGAGATRCCGAVGVHVVSRADLGDHGCRGAIRIRVGVSVSLRTDNVVDFGGGGWWTALGSYVSETVVGHFGAMQVNMVHYP